MIFYWFKFFFIVIIRLCLSNLSIPFFWFLVKWFLSLTMRKSLLFIGKHMLNPYLNKHNLKKSQQIIYWWSVIICNSFYSIHISFIRNIECRIIDFILIAMIKFVQSTINVNNEGKMKKQCYRSKCLCSTTIHL